MTASSRDADIRRNTWRRRHHRRDAVAVNVPMTVVQPPAKLAELLVTLSCGNISPAAARDVVASAKGGTTVEIVIDAETGLVESWSMRTGGSSRRNGGRAAIAPAA